MWLSAYVALDALEAGNAGVISGMTWGGLFGGIVVAVILMIMRPENPAVLMTIYAVMQGMFVGSLSLIFEAFYSGIIIQVLPLEHYSLPEVCYSSTPQE